MNNKTIIYLSLLIISSHFAYNHAWGALLATPVEQAQLAPEEEYGNKYLNLLRLHEITAQMPGVEVPIPHAVASSASHRFLEKRAPSARHLWEELGKRFATYKAKVDQDSWPAFVDQPEVMRDLNTLDILIELAYQRAASDPSLIEEMGINPEMINWMAEVSNRYGYLMVRSSGAEDTKKLANAGGNLSVAYVPPNPHDVAIAVGRVVRSYFSPSSLKNRLISGDHPFKGKQRLAVTVMELVGEPVGGTQNPASVPISMVLFTNEPLYTNNTFRIMRISASYGHGEAVVNNLGINSDTYLITDSAAHPLVISQIGHKTERLVPMIDSQGKVELQKQPNEPSQADHPALDASMLQRLYALGIAVEKAYGYPMDMEIVVKDGVIYPVQARPVNRPPMHPTYIDEKQLRFATPSPATQSQEGKVVVVGLANVQVLTSKEQILSSDTLEQAQGLFKKGLHQVVLIGHDEPANSHPVVNFSSWGIPSIYLSDHKSVDGLLQKVSLKTPLVVDSQSGSLFLWNTDIAPIANYVKEGYLIHPANIITTLDVSTYLINKRAQIANNSPDMNRAIQEVRDLCMTSNPEASLQLLHHLPALDILKTATEQSRHLRPSAQRRANLSLDLLRKIDQAWNQALNEWQTALSLPDPDQLRCRFHAKVAESVIHDWLSLATEEVSNLKAMGDYAQGFIFPSRFSEEAAYASATWDDNSAQAWLKFLTSLDFMMNRLPETAVQEDIRKFQNTLRLYDELGILPQWMFIVFSPIYLSRGSASTNEPVLVKEFFGQVLSQLDPNVEALINQLTVDKGLLVRAESQIPLFTDPKAFDPAWIIVQEAIRPFFSSTDGGTFLKSLESAPVVVKISASDVLNKAVALVDSAIKQMLASSRYQPQEKVDRLGQMLTVYYQLLNDWTEILVPEDRGVWWWQRDRYLDWLKNGLDKTGSGPDQLLPTPELDVSQSLMNQINLYKLPATLRKEAYFTLIHQNLLFILQRYLGNVLPKGLVFPTLLNALQQPHVTVDKELNRIDITPSTLALTYNVPLRQHSATITITYDKKSQHAEIDINFMGETESGRWEVIEEYAKLVEKAEGITRAKPSKRNPLTGVTLFWDVSTPEQARAIFRAFGQMVNMTYHFSGLYSNNLWGDLESYFMANKKNVPDEEVRLLIGSAVTKAVGEGMFSTLEKAFTFPSEIFSSFFSTIVTQLTAPEKPRYAQASQLMPALLNILSQALANSSANPYKRGNAAKGLKTLAKKGVEVPVVVEICRPFTQDSDATVKRVCGEIVRAQRGNHE